LIGGLIESGGRGFVREKEEEREEGEDVDWDREAEGERERDGMGVEGGFGRRWSNVEVEGVDLMEID
jgi:hypothetical protein